MDTGNHLKVCPPQPTSSSRTNHTSTVPKPFEFCVFCFNPKIQSPMWSAKEKINLLENFFRFLPQGPRKFPNGIDGEMLNFCGTCGFDKILLKAWEFQIKLNNMLAEVGKVVEEKEPDMFEKLYGNHDGGPTNSVEDTKTLLEIMKLRSNISVGYRMTQSAPDSVVNLAQMKMEMECEDEVLVEEPMSIQNIELYMGEPAEEVNPTYFTNLTIIKSEESMDELTRREDVGSSTSKNCEVGRMYDLGEDLEHPLEVQEADTEMVGGCGISNIRSLHEMGHKENQNASASVEQPCSKVKAKGGSRRNVSIIFPIALPNPPKFMLALPPWEALEAAKIVRQLGGFVSAAQGFDQSCHALVTAFLGPGEKISGSIISGKVVVRMQYLHLCQHFGKFVPIEKRYAWPYTVEEVAHARKLAEAEKQEDSDMS
ncbi:unnamed protein product [Orchesella dallaii]|uniref:BRCT domain-containing protein n=1 Tax=Orchesella dallaii TaxID=48710 RepID=A0ABP1RPM3_9HEXA